ncbi:MAG: hypothetical protein WCC17_18695 [Candidatus Nitrosopolaris sp.]
MTRPVTEKGSWKAHDGLNPDLYKVFERYNLGEKAMLCPCRNGQLNTVIRESLDQNGIQYPVCATLQLEYNSVTLVKCGNVSYNF